jgi:hypothetical protein
LKTLLFSIYEAEEGQYLNSFPYEATIGGKEHFYRITSHQDRYGIEQDGLVIAELAHGNGWQQISGKPLSKDLLQNICEYITEYYR